MVYALRKAGLRPDLLSSLGFYVFAPESMTVPWPPSPGGGKNEIAERLVDEEPTELIAGRSFKNACRACCSSDREDAASLSDGVQEQTHLEQRPVKRQWPCAGRAAANRLPQVQ
jgi:hypothetical protein